MSNYVLADPSKNWYISNLNISDPSNGYGKLNVFNGSTNVISINGFDSSITLGTLYPPQGQGQSNLYAINVNANLIMGSPYGVLSPVNYYNSNTQPVANNYNSYYIYLPTSSFTITLPDPNNSIYLGSTGTWISITNMSNPTSNFTITVKGTRNGSTQTISSIPPTSEGASVKLVWNQPGGSGSWWPIF